MNKNTRVKLNDGLNMPVVALGVWQSHEDTKNAVLNALKKMDKSITLQELNEKLTKQVAEPDLPENSDDDVDV